MAPDLASRSKLKFIPNLLLNLFQKEYNFNSLLHNKISWRLFYEIAIRGNQNELIAVTPRGHSRPIYLRRGTTDITNFVSIFINEEYQFVDSLCQNIVDLGAYIGISSAYFAAKCPGATILAVEPSPENYALCVLNNSSSPNVKIINAAVWGSSNTLQEHSRNYGHMSVCFEQADDFVSCLDSVKAITVTELMQSSKINYIDFLKVDIEGAERFVFTEPGVNEWLPKVQAMSVEIHESKFPGCNDAVYGSAKRFGFQESQQGEYTFFRKQK